MQRIATRRGKDRARIAAIAGEAAAALQPGGIVGIGEKQLLLLHRVDHDASDALAQRGATLAAAKPALGADQVGVRVPRAVHDDGALAGIVVEAGIQPVHPHRIAIAADIGFGGAVQAQAGGVAAFDIGKTGGDIVATALAVADVFAEQQLVACHIEHPQPLLRRRLRIIDDRQPRIGSGIAMAQRARTRLHRQREHAGIGIRRELHQLLQQ